MQYLVLYEPQLSLLLPSQPTLSDQLIQLYKRVHCQLQITAVCVILGRLVDKPCEQSNVL